MAEEPKQPTISADKLCLLTGVTDLRHRQLAAAGWFPKPVKAQYLLWPTLQGLFKYYREKREAQEGTLHDAKLRKARADAEAKERENLVRAGQLVEWDRAAELLSAANVPIVQRLDALPFEAATRCNPSDPQMAIEALQQWVAEMKPQIRATFPKAKT